MKSQQRLVVIAGREHPYALRRSRRAKNLLLHVDSAGAIEVVVPRHAAAREAEKFVVEKTQWLARALADAATRNRERVHRRLVSGEVLPLLGEEYVLRVVVDPWRERTSWGEEGRELAVFVQRREQVRAVVVRWYRARARGYFAAQVAELAAQLNVRPGLLAISAATSQWGSCIPATGRISLNWRLLLGPPHIARYVAAHEVVHLCERRHTRLFWQVVRQLDGDFTRHRKWLRNLGHTLEL